MQYSPFYVFGLLLLLVSCSSPYIETVNGQKIRYEKKTLIINYWAEWCEPCIKEIPELNQLNKINHIEVIGINFDNLKGENLITLGKKLGIKFELTNEALDQRFGYNLPEAIPMTVIVDRSLTTPLILMGPQTSEAILKTIKAHKI